MEANPPDRKAENDPEEGFRLRNESRKSGKTRRRKVMGLRLN
jgi:hypothetical protein